eukprot:CAMPEP_0197517044 /NCGR_PEP_ID=MMETSP1318-20131121/2006_1 /TAXON_ID=552666 /ORGANISM="Partenskyella glossopodia, Strain RCC365" /LENGTH=183 /DNA_ID=CAMNT_0043066277 /DNA_START=168 /DNA_END=719 /DNA_ORIENTATION=-
MAMMNRRIGLLEARGREGLGHSRAYLNPQSNQKLGLTSVPSTCRSILLFDGVCNMCNAWVNLVIDNDPKGEFCFASLQSDVGKKLLQDAGRDPNDLSSLLLADEQGYWFESNAALRVAKRLNSPVLTSAGTVLSGVPRIVRDQAYRVVADNRYSFLGRIGDMDTPRCKIGKDAQVLKARFLDD